MAFKTGICKQFPAINRDDFQIVHIGQETLMS